MKASLNLQNSIKKLRGLIVGCGSIGERHLHNLKKLGIQNIAIYDNDEKRTKEIAQKYKTIKFHDLDSALSFAPDFSFVCTYPTTHIKLANVCLDANSHVFIEKPLSFSIKGVEDMLTKAGRKRLQVAVGYNFRFEKGLCLLKEKLERSKISRPLTVSCECGNNIKFWRPDLSYKNHYILKKGGGIVLDDSHEYDYIRWILNDEVKSVYCQTQKTHSLKTNTESNAIIIMKFRKGTIATLIIDYVRPVYERKCQIIGEKGAIKWEFIPQNNTWKNYAGLAHSKVFTRMLGSTSLQKMNFSIKINYMYMEEIQNFIHSIIRNEKPTVDGWEGFKTLKIGLAALESATKNKVINL